MKEIPLTKGYVLLVDDEDYERVVALKWYASARKRTVYAIHDTQTAPGSPQPAKGAAVVCFRDQPDAGAVAHPVAGQDAPTVLEREFALAAVVLVNLSAIVRQTATEICEWSISGSTPLCLGLRSHR